MFFMKFHDFHGFFGFWASRAPPGRWLFTATRIPYYFIPQDSLFRGGEGGGVSSPGSPLLRLLSSTKLVEALIQSSLLYGAENPGFCCILQ